MEADYSAWRTNYWKLNERMETIMKRTFPLLLLLLFSIKGTNGQTENVNVLSYYAVGNSLDGQPMTDMTNVLRFFPVYAMRQQIDTVNVTVYYGPNIYTRDAKSFEDKRYWEVLLPQFKLGEAIQRLEVEIIFRIEDRYIARWNNLQLLTIDYVTEIDNVKNELNVQEENFSKYKRNVIAPKFLKNTADFTSLGFDSSFAADRLRKAYDSGNDAFIRTRDSILEKRSIKERGEDFLLTIEQLTKERSGIFRSLLGDYHSYRDFRVEKMKNVVSLNREVENLKDSLKSVITRQLEVGLTDTSYVGISVRKSDIVFSEDLSTARILYRNYKSALRQMPALDPAERMGIFRIRYVPFPIYGSDDKPTMNLRRPFTIGSPTVFEVGLAFGDAIVPGDDFVIPEFSWRRLGVAFAITEQLFADSAQVVALALTYDFNSYGSIGIGGNFAGSAAHGYASFGINKKAFEAVIKGIVGIFK